MPNNDTSQMSLLLPNGDLMVHGSGNNDVSKNWYLLTPDSTGSYQNGTWTQLASMNVGRLYFGSVVLPDNKVFVTGGEYSTDGTGSESNSAEIYDIKSNTWSMVASNPQAAGGDDPTELLPDGNILVGNIENDGTEIYNPTTNMWTTGPTKFHTDDTSAEEPWIKLPNGDILTYDITSSINSGQGTAEIYNPTTNTWSDASNGTLPLLTSANQGYELGAAVMLPDGRAFFTGANGLTAYFNAATDTWSQGPTMPTVMINNTSTQLTMGDAPAAVLPNGDVLLSMSPAVSENPTTFPPPTYLYDFNPTTGAYTDVTPVAGEAQLSSINSFETSFLVLPTGQIMLNDYLTNPMLYTPDGSPQSSWAPQVNSFQRNNDGTYTLTGTQLNGLDEGAAYGDDEQMNSNYPIVRFTDKRTGNVYYATTSNWSNVGVATGSTVETATITLPSSILNNNTINDVYSVAVIANGIASASFTVSPYVLDTNGNLINGNTILDTKVTQFSVTSNGDLVDLNTSGQLKEQTTTPGTWTQVDTKVTDFELQGSNGTGVVFDLHNDGTLWAQMSYLGALSQIDSSVTQFAIAGNGDVVDLRSDGSLHEFTSYIPATSITLDTGVTAFAIAGNGDVVDLHGGGGLYEYTAYRNASGYVQIDGGVGSFHIAGNGDVVDLHGSGSLYEFTTYRSAASGLLLDGGVKSFAIAGNGDVVDLHGGGGLYEFTAFRSPASFVQLDGGVSSFAIAGNGDVTDLHGGGGLFEFTAYRSAASYLQLDGGVSTFAIAGDGDVTDLHGGGGLYEFTAFRSPASYLQLDGGVTTLAIAGNGDVTDLHAGGILLEFTAFRSPASYVQLDGGVTTLAIVGNGDVADLHGGGGLYEFTAYRSPASFLQLDGGVTSFAIAGNGDVVDLHGAGGLYEFTVYRKPASYLQIDGGVSRFAISSDGFVEDQHFSGLMYIQAYFRGPVSQQISQFQ